MERFGFEWFVAWRHLRDPAKNRANWALRVGVALVVLAAIAFVAAEVLQRRPAVPRGFLPAAPSKWIRVSKLVGAAAAGAGLLPLLYGVFRALFTVFTAISIVGVFLGTAAPIIVLSVMSGFEADLVTKLRAAKADIVITRSDDKPFVDWIAVQKRVTAVPGVVAAGPYVETEVMLEGGGSQHGCVLRGIDPATAETVFDLGQGEGKFSDLAHPEAVAERARSRWSLRQARGEAPERDPQTDAQVPTILLGEELYTGMMQAFIGTEIDVVCPLCGVGISGPVPRAKPFRVAGHFKTGMFEYDAKLAYVALPTAQKFLGLDGENGGEITGLDLRTTNAVDVESVAAAVAKAVGPGYEVRSWLELNRSLFAALRLEKIAMFVVLTFIALVASFSIIANLTMLATEKAREIAILKAMGATDQAVMRVFFVEGLYIGVLGLVVGVTAGVGACALMARYGLPLPEDLYYMDRLPVVMRSAEIVTVAVCALILCCLATVYPASLASRLRTVEGLRYE